MPTPKRGPKRKPPEASPRSVTSLAGWEPPSHLKGEALKAWRHVVKLLASVGNLGRTDPYLVECYAIQMELLRQAHKAITKEGFTITNGMKATAAHPGIATINSATMRIKAIISDLGLCPATSKHAASSVVTTQDHTEGKWDGLLGIAN